MAAGSKTPSLYSRMQAHGTLTETPRDVPDARFALPSTIHWMRALAILAADQNLDFAAGRTFYPKVHARSVPDRELNTVYEQLLFVLNQTAALRALASASNKADVARTAIVARYYGVYTPLDGSGSEVSYFYCGEYRLSLRDWRRVSCLPAVA